MEIVVVERISESNKKYYVTLTKEEYLLQYRQELLQAKLRVDSWKYCNQHLSQFE